MPRVTVEADYGRAPEKDLLRDLFIDSINTQRRLGAIYGVITSEQGESVAFCDICQLDLAAGNRIKSMKSYTVEIGREN